MEGPRTSPGRTEEGACSHGQAERRRAVRRHPRPRGGASACTESSATASTRSWTPSGATAAIDWVQVRHEETAAFAAGAEAQITGKLAACAGSCGPGNLHLINGLYDAHRSMAPVLALASHIPSSEIGLGYFQETHPDRLFRECSHYSEMISNPKQMPRLLQTAIQHAVGQQRRQRRHAARRHRRRARPRQGRRDTPWSPRGPPCAPATRRSTSSPR